MTNEQMKSIFTTFVNLNAKSFAGWTTKEIRDEFNRMDRQQIATAQVQEFMPEIGWVLDDEQKVWFRKPFEEHLTASRAIKQLIDENPDADSDALAFLHYAFDAQRAFEMGDKSGRILPKDWGKR